MIWMVEVRPNKGGVESLLMITLSGPHSTNLNVFLYEMDLDICGVKI
jgi:hypothetical protein